MGTGLMCVTAVMVPMIHTRNVHMALQLLQHPVPHCRWDAAPRPEGPNSELTTPGADALEDYY